MQKHWPESPNGESTGRVRAKSNRRACAAAAAPTTTPLRTWSRDRADPADPSPWPTALPRRSRRSSSPAAAPTTPSRPRAQARPHPRQALVGPARPLRRAARPAEGRQGLRRRRRPQLRRARGHPRAPRDVRRPALGRARAGRRRRQLQPGDDARGARRPLAQGRRRQRAPVGRGGEGQVHLPGSRLRPAPHAAELVRHRDGHRADERRRPGRRRGGPARGDDPSVKGIWVVPTYANPSGAVATQEVAERLASMETAAPDFKIFWDNAYAFHHLTEDEAKSADVLSLAAAAGHPHRPIMFASTSKITYAGAGVAFLGRVGRDGEVVHRQPRQGRDRPRQAQPAAPRPVLRLAPGRARPHGQAPRDHRAEVRRGRADPAGAPRRARDRDWTQPTGGYFVSLDVLDGTASRVVELAKEAGVALTPGRLLLPATARTRATATSGWPRPSPSREVSAAMEAVATCVLLAAAEKCAADAVQAHRQRPAGRPEPRFRRRISTSTSPAPCGTRRCSSWPSATGTTCPTPWSRTGRRPSRRPTRRAGSASSGSTTSPGRCCGPRTTSPPRARGRRGRQARRWSLAGDPGGPERVRRQVRRDHRLHRPGAGRRRESSREVGIGMAVVIAANRTRHPLDARTLARLAAQYAGRGVVGFGLSNDERRGRNARLRPGVPDRRAGRAGAGPARR